jgi:small subunit ribosomal protein S6
MSAHKYELMMIVDPEIEDSSVRKLVENYLKVITDGKGTVDKNDFWGRRKLAYEINDKSEGVYVVIDYTCEPAVSAELHRQLGLDTSVLRTKILRRDAK